MSTAGHWVWVIFWDAELSGEMECGGTFAEDTGEETDTLGTPSCSSGLVRFVGEDNGSEAGDCVAATLA